MEVRQSRNLDCAVRRDWKDVERWVSSASSWVFRSWSWGIGRDVISTVGVGFVSCAVLFSREGQRTLAGLGGLLSLGGHCVLLCCGAELGGWVGKVKL